MKKQNYKKKAIILVILWGAVLAVGGALNGNNAIINPDLSGEKAKVLERQISSNAFNCWLTNNRSGFTLVEFAEEGVCTTDLNTVKRYTCLDSENLQDLKWIRSTFKSRDRQMIIYSQSEEQNLHASALLSYYGYNVRMLQDTVDIATKESLVTDIQPVSNDQTISPAILPVEASDSFEEEMEDEEEGC